MDCLRINGNASSSNLIDWLLAFQLVSVVEDIFLYLDCQSLTSAECASPRWSHFIQSSQKLYHKKVRTIGSWLGGHPPTSRPLGTIQSQKILYGSPYRAPLAEEEDFSCNLSEE
jgi:hypothetical protein